MYLVDALLVNNDPATEHLTIDNEQLETTPEHPFYTLEAGWTPAGKLWAGAHVQKAGGAYGVVTALTVEQHPQKMYNLTVEKAHTFFVGKGQWLVHNMCSAPRPRNSPDQDALIQLVKESVRKGSVSQDEAQILIDWANEYNLPARGPEMHPNRPFGKFPHIHIGPINHIIVR